jgi:hypothetical protein
MEYETDDQRLGKHRGDVPASATGSARASGVREKIAE